MNPTNDILEKRVAAIDNGVGALAVASGQAASLYSIQNICVAGDNFVCSEHLYGGTWNLLKTHLKTWVLKLDLLTLLTLIISEKRLMKKPGAYYAETLPNPSFEVFPIGEVAEIGKELGVPLIVDNTAAPVLCRPFDHGAAITIYSATKFIGGHGTTIGGLLVDSGNFNWETHSDRFPKLNKPDPNYHGVVWTEAAKALGPIAYLLKARVTLLRDSGAAMSPFNAFQFIQGLETLPLRMERHCENAVAVATFLSNHPKITRVIHPSVQEERLKSMPINT